MLFLSRNLPCGPGGGWKRRRRLRCHPPWAFGRCVKVRYHRIIVSKNWFGHFLDSLLACKGLNRRIKWHRSWCLTEKKLVYPEFNFYFWQNCKEIWRWNELYYWVKFFNIKILSPNIEYLKFTDKNSLFEPEFRNPSITLGIVSKYISSPDSDEPLFLLRPFAIRDSRLRDRVW